MEKQRNHCMPEEKVAILRWHLLDKEPISQLRDEGGRGGKMSLAALRRSLTRSAIHSLKALLHGALN